MILNLKDCVGCGACYNVCEFNAIKMIYDVEGFVYSKINIDKCVKCNKCLTVCPVINKPDINKKFNIYAGYDKNKNIVKMSSSGGLFRRFAKYILNQNGIVFGVGFDELKLKHLEINSLDNLNKICGSKYVQSYIGDSYKKVKIALNENKKILFSGTPCQISGLKSYLKYFGLDNNSNLFTIAIVCHGVPSTKIFNDYINLLQNKYNSKVKNINFRNKLKGWQNYYITIEFDDKKIIQKASKNSYMIGFLKNYYLRKTCYNCKFKETIKDIDILLGDAWGIKNNYPDIYNKNGTSILIINSKQGEYLYKKNLKYLKLKKINYNFVKKYNPCIYKSVKDIIKRKNFFELYLSEGFKYVYIKFMRG